MLIPSARHKKEDLELWKDLARFDLFYAQRNNLQIKADKAIDVILEFIKQEKAYCGVSWGKDSVVVAHLIYRIQSEQQISIPLYWISLDEVVNPDCVAVRNNFLTRFNINYREVKVDAYDTNGDLIPTGRLEKGIDQVAAFCGTQRYISGIRAEESAARRVRVMRWGYSSKNTCAPLAHWKVQDIFSYLAINDLPIHPVYAMLGKGRWERKHLRVGSIGGERGQQFGRLEWEKEYYRDVICNIHPEFY